VIFSAWLVYEIFYSGWSKEYSFWCEPLDTTNSPLALSMAAAAWWYYISKFTEFFDTFFFILRKKTDNVSTLHVMHHGIMPLFAWEACR
jgi:elongation of very long chain fatty acids protein 7